MRTVFLDDDDVELLMGDLRRDYRNALDTLAFLLREDPSSTTAAGVTMRRLDRLEALAGRLGERDALDLDRRYTVERLVAKDGAGVLA